MSGRISSPLGQYSVPTEQQFSGEPSYTSEASMGVYTSSSSSLVLGGTGRTVLSNPGSPKATMAKLNQPTSYSDQQLPLPVCTDATVVIGEGNHSAYITACNNSNDTLVMSQMAMSSEDLPNEVCNSRNSNMDRLHSKILMNQTSIPIDPLQGSDVYFREAASTATDYSNEADGDVDISVLLDSTCMGFSVPDQNSGSMVTGLGGEGGIQNPALQSAQGNVYEDPFDTMMRDLGTYDVGLPDLELLKLFDAGTNMECNQTEFLSTPVSSDLINGFGGMSIKPVQAGQQPSGIASVSVQEQSTTGDNLDIIKMLNVQLKPTAPSSLGLKESNHMVPVGHIPSPAHAEQLVPPSPGPAATPYSPATPGAPIQASIPPSPAPSTPKTPKPASCMKRGPFMLNTYIKDDQRVCEVSVCPDLTPAEGEFATRALLFSLESHVKISGCLRHPCDLKVAIDARAELAASKFDMKTATLQFTMPADCMLLDQWMLAHKDSIDLRDRQLILQQVANLLASVHTVGNDDKLCLWGSFVVWVAPNKQVYLLIDFPEMLCKMESQAASISFDPRIEDVKALFGLHQTILSPFINHDSSWVSPGVRQLVESFSTLVTDPSSVYRMAELARTLGERRLCKLEVELMTLPHYVYCVEHEVLANVLSHVTSMVPPVECDHWEVQWAETGRLVELDAIASAHRPIRLFVKPVLAEPVSFLGQSRPQGLSFQCSNLKF